MTSGRSGKHRSAVKAAGDADGDDGPVAPANLTPRFDATQLGEARSQKPPWSHPASYPHLPMARPAESSPSLSIRLCAAQDDGGHAPGSTGKKRKKEKHAGRDVDGHAAGSQSSQKARAESAGAAAAAGVAAAMAELAAKTPSTTPKRRGAEPE